LLLVSIYYILFDFHFLGQDQKNMKKVIRKVILKKFWRQII